MGKRKRGKNGYGYTKSHVTSHSVSAAVKKEIRKEKMKNCEIKFKKTTLTSPFTSTGLMTYLSGVAQGIDEGDRIGNKVKSYSLSIGGRVSSSADTSDRVQARVVVFIDWQNNGILPPITSLWTTMADFFDNCPRDGDSHKFRRFTIIYDSAVTEGASGWTGVATKVLTIRMFLDKGYVRPSHELAYDAAGSGVGNAGKGSIFAMSGSSSDVASNVQIVWKYTD